MSTGPRALGALVPVLLLVAPATPAPFGTAPATAPPAT